MLAVKSLFCKVQSSFVSFQLVNKNVSVTSARQLKILTDIDLTNNHHSSNLSSLMKSQTSNLHLTFRTCYFEGYRISLSPNIFSYSRVYWTPLSQVQLTNHCAEHHIESFMLAFLFLINFSSHSCSYLGPV